MHISRIALPGLLVATAYAQNDAQQRGGGNNNNAGNNAGGATVLDTENVQIGSTKTGREALGANEAQQAASATDAANFINFCTGKKLTNGLQHVDGSCNGIPMGDIPTKQNMVSSLIMNPISGQTINAGEDFDIQVQVDGLAAGSFTNAVATYYSAPQALEGGVVVGHTHVTVQNMGGTMNPQQPLDPVEFEFFKGINDAGDGAGGLSTTVVGGLLGGFYRICTMTSASNHQPVIMPVAQRGSADDCIRIEVVGNGGEKNPAANDGVNGLAAAKLAADAVALGPGVDDPNAGTEAATSAAVAGGNGGDTNGRGRGGKAASATAAAAAATGAANEGNNNGQNAGSNAGQSGGRGGGFGGQGAGRGGGGGRQGGQGKFRRSRRAFVV